jgi:hypothetical protein
MFVVTVRLLQKKTVAFALLAGYGCVKPSKLMIAVQCSAVLCNPTSYINK